MMSLDQFLEEGSQSILRLFSIQALCKTCQVSLNVENGDLSQLLMHVKENHSLMLMKQEEDFSDQYSDLIDNNGDHHSTTTDILNHSCKNDADVKEEEARVEDVIPVSIKILKASHKGKVKKKRKNKPDLGLRNGMGCDIWKHQKEDIWRHWNIEEKVVPEAGSWRWDGLCSCNYCGKRKTVSKGDLRQLKKHTKLIHLEKLDEDLQKVFEKEIRPKKNTPDEIWSYFDASDDTKYCKVFNCKLCNSLVIVDQTPKSKLLIQHLAEYHELQYKEYRQNKAIVCADCGKTFDTRAGLQYHVRVTHTEQIKPAEKPFLCTYCGKGFNFKISWKNHVASHTGKFNFFCSVCHKGFPLKSVLERHFIMHTGEKPYKCEKCGQAFARSSYHRHIKTKCQ